MAARIELRLADITAQDVDAIVNAANSHLAHGGGVAAAIARAGGPDLVDASAAAPFVETGDALATTAGNLPSRHVIHAVGPVWHGGREGEPDQLASAYGRAIEIATELKCASIAFPSISTGIYGFPIELAAPIALGAVDAAVAASDTVTLARFCLFAQADLDAYSAGASEIDLAAELHA